MNLEKICSSLRAASQKLALQNACEKNAALEAVAAALDKNRASIIAANKIDVDSARANGISESIIDRLLLDDKESMELSQVYAKLSDRLTQSAKSLAAGKPRTDLISDRCVCRSELLPSFTKTARK